MSCDQSTAPINIPSSSSVYPCDLKCAYTFDYGNSNCNISNEQSYIKLMYDKSSNAKAITYNKINLHVQEIRIYSPSLHKYNGKQVDAELLIIHGGNGINLIVSVPIVAGTKISKGGSLLNDIIYQGAKSITNLGESASLGIDNYNMNHIVPKKPYFSYSGTMLVPPCIGVYNYIVFDKEHAINISKISLKQIKKIIEPLPIKIRNTEPFYNKLGPNVSINSSDEIYIECNPTGDSGEVLLYSNNSKDNGDFEAQFDEFMKSPIFKILTAIAMILFAVGLFNMIVQRFTSKHVGAGNNYS